MLGACITPFFLLVMNGELDKGRTLSGDDIKKLRVCLLLPKLQIGGAEVQVLHLLKNLDKSRFSVSLCCFSRGDVGMEEEAGRHAESVFILGFRWRTLPVSFVRLVKYLRAHEFDVLHAHLALADMIGRMAGMIARVPVLMTTEHGKHLWKSRPYLMLERMIGSVTDMRICVSRDIMAIRERREGTGTAKLAYVPNAVDPSVFRTAGRGRGSVMAEFGWEAEDAFIISVGRLVSAKNYPLLVEAIGLLRSRVPNVRCLLVGEGDCRREITERIDSLGISDNVKIAGSRRDIPDLLTAADVFVLSSIREGLPVSLLEAMAAGKAVAGTNVGGIPDAVEDDVSGILVPPGDASALAGALGRLLGDAELRRRLGISAAETIDERFSVHRTARRIGEIYEELYGIKDGRRQRRRTEENVVRP
jgi:glycosyltransferase involved in cell wall biosynthesis